METDNSLKRAHPGTTEFDTNEILAIVREMREHPGPRKERTRVFKSKYPDFVEKYPTIFEMASQSVFDMQRFEYMINLKKDIDSNKTTVEDASKVVGQKMFDIYVKPKL